MFLVSGYLLNRHGAVDSMTSIFKPQIFDIRRLLHTSTASYTVGKVGCLGCEFPSTLSEQLSYDVLQSAKTYRGGSKRVWLQHVGKTSTLKGNVGITP